MEGREGEWKWRKGKKEERECVNAKPTNKKNKRERTKDGQRKRDKKREI